MSAKNPPASAKQNASSSSTTSTPTTATSTTATPSSTSTTPSSSTTTTATAKPAASGKDGSSKGTAASSGDGRKGSGPGELDIETVAHWLLEKEYELTALELHQEIVENGAKPSKSLQKRFGRVYADRDLLAAPGSHMLSDSIVNAAQQRVVGEAELRAAAAAALEEAGELRYELGVAREDLATTRKELEELRRQLAEQRPVAAPKTAVELSSIADLGKTAISRSELCALRSITYRFLLEQGMKMTSISFSDELPGDPHTWGTEVGEDNDPLPSFLILYRYFYHTGSNLEIGRLKNALRDFKRMEKENASLKSQVAQLSSHSEELGTEVHALRKQIERLREKLKEATDSHKDRVEPIQPPHHSSSTNNTHPSSSSSSSSSSSPHNSRDNSSSGAVTPNLIIEDQSDRKFTLTPPQSSASEDEIRISASIERVASYHADEKPGVLIVADCLPHLVKGVLFAKRAELLPIFLCIIRFHPESSMRDMLTRLLFNLIVKPDQMQREMIMRGCIGLAGLIGRQRTEVELLPQCWEQIGDKNEERRILVAESCGCLAPYVRPELRPSLILSILSQLLEDPSPAVRQAVSRNFGRLVSHFGRNESSKFSQIQEILLRLMFDKDQSVAATTQRAFLPIFADWGDACSLLPNKLFEFLFTEIENRFARKHKAGRLYEDDLFVIQTLFDSIGLATPRLCQSLFLRAPFALAALKKVRAQQSQSKPDQKAVALAEDDEDEDEEKDPFRLVAKVVINGISDTWPSILSPEPGLEKELQTRFTEWVERVIIAQGDSGTEVPWDYLTWVIKEYVPKLIAFVTNNRLADDGFSILQGASSILNELCKGLGSTFCRAAVVPSFMSILGPQQASSSSSAGIMSDIREQRSRILPLYVAGVLPVLGQEALLLFVRETIQNIALQEGNWFRTQLPDLKLAIQLLLLSADNFRTPLFVLLKELSGHHAVPIRGHVAHLFDVAVEGSDEDVISAQILPAIISLSNDVDMSVRISSVSPLGFVALAATSDRLLDRIALQLTQLFENSSNAMKCEVIRTIARIVPDAKPSFRDNCLLPMLSQAAHVNNRQKNQTQRKELAEEIYSGYRALNGIVLESAVVKKHVLPGMATLLNDAPVMDSNFKSRLQTMIASMETSVSEGPDEFPISILPVSSSSSASSSARAPAAIWSKIKESFPKQDFSR